MKKPLISIVSPCYNEEKNLLELFERLNSTLKPFCEKYEFEFIFTDNDSPDNTFKVLTELATNRPHVKALRFTRNIGLNRSIYLGLKQAKGDAVVLILSDLEDPPELLAEFIKGWEEGFDVVYGKIKNRREGFIIKNVRRVYYRIISSLSEYPIPRDATEFRLTSKRVNDAVLGLNDDDPYVRGNVAFVGYQQKSVDYIRDTRKAGKSNFNLFSMISFAINGLTSTTQTPIRSVTVLGFFITILSFLHVIYLIVRKFMLPDSIPLGFITLISLITFLAGVQILSIGIIGEYIRKIYLQSLNRPKGYVRDSVNLD